MSTEAAAPPAWVYVAPLGEAAQREALRLASELREAGIEARVDGRGQKLNRMLPRASSSGARFCVILGDGELERGVVALKDLQAHTQEEPPRGQLLARLREILGEAAR